MQKKYKVAPLDLSKTNHKQKPNVKNEQQFDVSSFFLIRAPHRKHHKRGCTCDFIPSRLVGVENFQFLSRIIHPQSACQTYFRPTQLAVIRNRCRTFRNDGRHHATDDNQQQYQRRKTKGQKITGGNLCRVSAAAKSTEEFDQQSQHAGDGPQGTQVSWGGKFRIWLSDRLPASRFLANWNTFSKHNLKCTFKFKVF